MAFLAVCLATVFRKCTASKRRHAERAHEMLGVPLLIQSIDNASSNSFSASRTQASGLLVVVDVTVWLAAVFVKLTAAKGLLAIIADKVLWMPLLA